MKVNKQLERVADAIVDKFCKKQEMDVEFWIDEISFSGLMISDMYLSLHDIILDLQNKVPKGEIMKWYWTCLEAESKINYKSWLMGARPDKIE